MPTPKSSKPTPGEWVARGTRVEVAGRPGFRGDFRVADAYTSDAGLANTPSREEALDNARLIAAAPALLEAVKAMQRAFENYGAEFNPSGKAKKVCDWGALNEDLSKARAAIAKAEGK